MLEGRNFENDIIIGKTSGFCYGVKNAVEKSKQEIEKNKGKIYCLGELVHNKSVTEELKEKGLIFIDDIEEAKGDTIIRAHGVAKEIYEKAKQKNIKLIDLTCPNVLKIHNIAQEYADKRYYIFLIGKKDHPEIIGTYSFCGKNATIISKIEDVKEAIQRFKKTKLNKLLIISQTTYNLKVFDDIVEEVKKNIKNNVELEIKNTICLATELRQKETKEISQKVDLMIIVGGKNSSNTNKLYDISCVNCRNVIFAENEKDINIDKIKEFKTIGIMAGASTPNKSIEEIVRQLGQSKIVS